MTKQKELRQEFLRKSFRENMIKELGCKCCNCGSTSNIEYHHIVPIVNGGSNNLSNIVPLCKSCHFKAHDKTFHKHKNGGRPSPVTYEEALPYLEKYFNCEIGKKELASNLGYKNAKYVGESTLFKKYKEDNNIGRFRNNIDIQAFHRKRRENVEVLQVEGM